MPPLPSFSDAPSGPPSRQSINSVFKADEPVERKPLFSPVQSPPPIPQPAPRTQAPPLNLDTLPKISMPRSEGTDLVRQTAPVPSTGVSMPAPPNVVSPKELKAPEPFKRENSKLAKVLEELAGDDMMELPPLPHASPVRSVPRFEPLMTRETTVRRGQAFVSMNVFEDTMSQVAGVVNHLHNVQVHNEKLGMIETHTKNELDSLVNTFEILQRHLLSVDDKLFVQGE